MRYWPAIPSYDERVLAKFFLAFSTDRNEVEAWYIKDLLYCQKGISGLGDQRGKS